MRKGSEAAENISRDFLMTLSNPWFKSVMDVQHLINTETHRFWDECSFRCINLPITTGSISSPMGLGSDSLPVQVNLMGADTYLADSMQFALEFGCRIADTGCYYIMPSFRGEQPDKTHLCQFFHSEMEFRGNLEKVMVAVEGYIKSLAEAILDRLGSDLFQKIGDLSHIEHLVLQSESFSSIRFSEARKILKDDPRYIKDLDGVAKTLTKAGEQKLLRLVSPVLWVTHFDHLSVPFYQAFDKEDPKQALAADLLMGPGEIAGAGQRHTNVAELLEALKLHQVSADSYQWYCDMREVFPMETAGFGLGIERFMMWLFKHDDIRDFEILPRVNGETILP